MVKDGCLELIPQRAKSVAETRRWLKFFLPKTSLAAGTGANTADGVGGLELPRGL